MLKIEIDEVINNYHYWFHTKELAKYDVFVDLGEKQCEFVALSLNTFTVSYKDGEKIVTIPLLNIKGLIIKDYPSN